MWPERVIFKISSRMKNYCNFKDKNKQELRSLSVFNFKHISCNTVYLHKTKRHYRTQTSENIGVSPLTGKCIKNNSQTSALCDCMVFVRQLFVLKIFQFLLKVHVIANLRFRKVFWLNYWNISSVPLHLRTVTFYNLKKTSPQYRYICFNNDSRKDSVIIYHNPGQNMWNKLEKSSKFRRKRKVWYLFSRVSWLLLPKFNLWTGDWALDYVSNQIWEFSIIFLSIFTCFFTAIAKL